MFGKDRKGDPTDEMLRVGRPQPSDELVRELSARVPARPRQRSRSIVALAVMVFMLGTFASFGGFGYAASGAKSAAQKAGVTASSKTSAGDQYGEQTAPTVKPPSTTEEVAGTTATSPKSDTLPFTGLGLATTAVVGVGLLGLGLMLRRRESRD